MTDAGIERSVELASDGSRPGMARNLKLMSAGVLGSALIQYALYFWLARYLGSQDYGTFSIALTVAILAAPLCDLGMSVSLVRTCSQRPEALPRVLGACLRWRAIACVPTALCGLAACKLAGYSDQVCFLFVPLYLAALFDGVCTLGSAVFQAREELAGSSSILLGRNLLRAAALLVAVSASASVESLALLFLLASAIAAVAAWRMVQRRTAVRFERGATADALRTALPFGFAIVAVLLHAQVDVALLGHFRGESEVGLYHAGMRFLVLAHLVPQTVAIVAAPRVHRLGMQGVEPSSRFYRLQATALAVLGLCGSLVLALHGERLVAVCLGPEYQDSAFLVIAVAPAIFLRFLSAPLAATLSGIGGQRRLTLGYWLALLVNLVANLLLIPTQGAQGVVLATLASETFLLTFLTAACASAGVRLGWSSVLRHPLAIALSIAALYFACAWSLPPGAQLFLVPCGVLVYGWLVRREPTEEERILLGRGGTSGR